MNKALSSALRLLTRREHSVYELACKLTQKGYASSEIEAAIAECQRLGLQSDERFVETICRTRIRQGYGPLRIQQELRSLRIEETLINTVLQQKQDHWLAHAIAVKKKKYKNQGELTFKQMQKQKQFLLYRGFSADIIAMVFNETMIE
ncbi:recombination regulator RecX [Legionella nagasakiensis]|uniref:recombination regulator RecX n=1 Tax=Legionella nagasakiensis TaxID=535290 RepID=UPI00105652BB|nr:recombination regulator RecX [Legionella nagasakiensis]